MGTEAYFGTDGIRDRAGHGHLSPESLRKIGSALGAFAKDRFGPRPRIFFGRDTRYAHRIYGAVIINTVK